MRTSLILTLLALILLSTSAFAGPNAGGMLILHANQTVLYTTDTTSYCGQSGLAHCGLAVTTVPVIPSVSTVFFALAAFPTDASPRLAGVTFGVEYDPTKFVLLNQRDCADFELATVLWPASGSGTALTWNSPLRANLAEVYWFAGYAYSELDSTTFDLAPHPTQGGTFVDDSVPPLQDPIACFGKLGFNHAPDNCCLEVDPAGTPATTLSSSLELQNVFPNPGAGRITITYQLTESANITLCVLNPAGQRIRILESGATSPGSHTAEWDLTDSAGRKLQSGMYIVHLLANGMALSKKVVIP